MSDPKTLFQLLGRGYAPAILGKATDWLTVAATRPFLRWEDRFAPHGTN